MKYALPVLILIFIIAFTSCKKDNSPGSIVGKWFWVEQTYDSYTNNVLTNHSDYTTALDPLSYFEFDADGTFIEKPQSTTNVFNYGKYHIIGDSLYVKRDIDQNEIHYFIKNLTTSSLIIHATSIEQPYRGEEEFTMKR